jgi:putative two-component system response regulator
MDDKNKRQTILVVDDIPANIEVLSGILKDHYRVKAAINGNIALDIATSYEQLDLILLDVEMPEMDGYEVCKRLKSNPKTANIPVIFVTTKDKIEDETHGFEVGGVDYITKPVRPLIVQARVSTHLSNHEMQKKLEQHNTNLSGLVQEQIEEISQAQMATILAMSKLAEARDDDTGKHIERIQIFSNMLALRLQKDELFTEVINTVYINDLFHASPLHDIGKIAIPDAILLKPGQLTSEEFEIMKTHAEIGAKNLAYVAGEYPNNTFINMGIDIAASHHEKWNGKGYPEGLVADEIPLSARILAVADVYDALRSKRVYKDPFTHKLSSKIIVEERGSHFDPIIVDTFIKLESEFNETRDQMND